MGRRGRLNRLKVDGYKSIEHLDLCLKPLNILLGANGAGKSNFIGLFKFVNQLVNKNLQFHVAQQLGADKLLFFGRKRTSALTIDLHFTPNAYSVTLAPDAAGGLLFQEEICKFFGHSIGYSGGTQHYHLGTPGARESALESALPDQPHTKDATGHIVGYLRDWKVYHFHDTSESARVKQPGRIDETAVLLPQADNLAAFLRALRDTPAYALIVRTIQRVAPFFLDFVLEPEPDNSRQIRLRWRHRGSDDTFDAGDFSDGTLRFICLTTLLLQPRLPTIILLDEPELGLHPYALQLLAGMMRTASGQTQIIASTQSVTLANQFSWEDLIVVDLIADASRFRRLNAEELDQWLDDYAVGELWEKNILGGTP
jgi:predicted ATPase